MVGDEVAQHAWVKKKGVHLAVLRVELTGELLAGWVGEHCNVCSVQVSR